MENNYFFDKAHKLVHEHDELTQLRNDLQIATTSLGVIFNDWEGPGVNYKSYSKDVKKLIINAINSRLHEIELNFN